MRADPFLFVESPHTPSEPDAYAFLEFGESSEREINRAAREVSEKMAERGVTHCRATLVDRHHNPKGTTAEPHGIWIEGWFQRPEREAPFHPPLAAA